jgi:hypothetical protein
MANDKIRAGKAKVWAGGVVYFASSELFHGPRRLPAAKR